MEKINYGITDWIYCFNDKNKINLNKIASSDKNKAFKEELITWKLITVYLPIVTFISVIFLNLITNLDKLELFFSFVNNGSLPIISFGIITSGMTYLLERLEEFPDFYSIRRRVMAVSLIFLFLSAVLYILQTLLVISATMSCISNGIILFISIWVFLFAKSLGVKMFTLQSKNVSLSFDEDMKNSIDSLKDSLNDID